MPAYPQNRCHRIDGEDPHSDVRWHLRSGYRHYLATLIVFAIPSAGITPATTLPRT
jgi:hypothetical protein